MILSSGPLKIIRNPSHPFLEHHILHSFLCIVTYFKPMQSGKTFMIIRRVHFLERIKIQWLLMIWSSMSTSSTLSLYIFIISCTETSINFIVFSSHDLSFILSTFLSKIRSKAYRFITEPLTARNLYIHALPQSKLMFNNDIRDKVLLWQ